MRMLSSEILSFLSSNIGFPYKNLEHDFINTDNKLKYSS